MRTKAMLLALVAATSCAALLAQDAPKAATKDPGKPPQQMAMQMPTPAPEMTKLIKQLSGSWTVTEKHYPNPMMPNGGTGKGTAVLTPGPGNLSLVEKYHSVGAMGSFSGMGVFWWDPKIQAYRGLWCDNLTPTGCDTSGTTKWDGDNLVGTMEADMGGQKMVSRFTYSDWKPSSFTMTMEMGNDPNALQKAMVVTYTKADATAKMEKPGQ
jgi:arabinogalactan endo-1,4-beta-galactosidase